MATNFVEHRIDRAGHALYARDYPGTEPAIVLLHGFPDNLHLYDSLVPFLVAAGRRVISFDFLGWGESDKPDAHRYDHNSLTDDLDAVLNDFGLTNMILVAHDASGPAVIDWSLDHPQEVAGMVLLNTYYHAMPSLRAPEAIFGFSRPLGIGKLFQWLMERGNLFQRLYGYQVGHFIRDKAARDHYVPLLYAQMDGPADATTRKAFYALNDDLIWTNIERLRRVPEMRQFDRPVRIIFGTGDQYLNEGVARAFHTIFPRSELFLLPEGRHFVQIDEPEQVASLILTLPQVPAKESEDAGPMPGAVFRARLRYRFIYMVFSLMTILLAPAFLFDRWRIYKRVQRVFEQDNALASTGNDVNLPGHPTKVHV
jgi:pimeloyl-ACP methyl ester carboxylesterase